MAIFSFSKFFAEIGLDCEVDPSFQPRSSLVSSVTSYIDNAISGCSSSDQADSSLSPVSDKEINIQGEDCVGFVKAVTKFVKIFSPGLYDKERAQAQGLEPNGFSFEGTDAGGVDYALNRSIFAWFDAREWFNSLCKRVMELYHSARK